MNALAKLFRRNLRDWLLALEAFAFLCVAKAVVMLVPFRRYAPRLGRSEAETPAAISPADRRVAVKISWAVQAVARHVSLGFVCLPQALAAQRMLRRRRLPNTIYFGVSLIAPQQDDMMAHAWIRAGDKIVTGEREIAGHVVVAKFADEAR